MFRAFLKVVAVLGVPETCWRSPGMFDKVVELGSSWRDDPIFAPTREELLAIVAG